MFINCNFKRIPTVSKHLFCCKFVEETNNMIKGFILILLVVVSIPLGYSQEETNERIGSFFIEPYVGLINPGRVQLGSFIREQNSYSNPGYLNKSKQIGIPVILGTKLEYMLTNTVGLGLDFNYQESGYKNEQTYETYDYLTSGYKDTSVYRTWKEQRLRIMARFQAHFGNYEKVDLYAGGALGVGYVLNRDDNYFDNRPDVGDYDVLFIPIKIVDHGLKDGGIPIALRGFFGARIMFSDNIGMLAEVGVLSGSLINLGVTVKL